MRNFAWRVASALAITLLAHAGWAVDDEGKPTTDTERMSYAFGLNFGKSFHEHGIDVDTAMLMKGLEDGLAGAPSRMTDEELTAAQQLFQQTLAAKAQKRQAATAGENKIKATAFLEDNKTREGVVTLDSGLQYEVLQEGDGSTPKASDKVTVHYRGTLLDGTVFDSSYDRGQPATFGVSSVIKGWTEALQLMKVGSKWKLFLPAELAYGDRGAGTRIPPGSALIFEVELLGIDGADE